MPRLTYAETIVRTGRTDAIEATYGFEGIDDGVYERA